MTTDANIQKKPLDYIKLVFRRKWLIIIPALIGIIGGIVAVNTLPKIYQASTLVLVEEGRVINPLVQGLAVSTSVAQRLAVLREQILGWDRLNQLITKLDLAKDVKNQQDFEGLIARLRKSIMVKLYGQNIISILYQGKDPAEDMNIVKTITDIFIAENLRQQNSETENAIAFINDQLDLYQKKLKQGEVASMEEKLNGLLLDSTDKHPVVIELRKKIASAKGEMEKGDYTIKNAAPSEADNGIASLKEELGKMREELATSGLDTNKGGVNRTKLAATTNEKLYKLLLLDKVEKVTTQDMGVNQRLYNELLERLETAKITQRLEASKDGTRYTILDPARLPLTPVKPNKLYVMLAGLFAGLCLGLGLIFTVEMFDGSFIAVDEASAYLEKPVFGAISKIVTEKDLALQRVHNIKIVGISILTVAALLVVIIFNVILGS